MKREVIAEESTQKMLQRLRDNVTNYNPKDWYGITKEELQARYEIIKRVSETLKSNELMLIYYLRTSKCGATHRFVQIAKKLCEANRELSEITKY